MAIDPRDAAAQMILNPVLAKHELRKAGYGRAKVLQRPARSVNELRQKPQIPWKSTATPLRMAKRK